MLLFGQIIGQRWTAAETRVRSIVINDPNSSVLRSFALLVVGLDGVGATLAVLVHVGIMVLGQRGGYGSGCVYHT